MGEFEVLGPVRLSGTDGMVEPGGRLQRILLGVLLAKANESVSVDVLTDALWGGEPVARSAQKLQLHVHKLRRALDDPARLSYGPAGYRLLVRPGELDAERFATLVRAATVTAGSDPARCAGLLRTALDLFRGTPYDGLDVPLLADEAAMLAERQLGALELRFEMDLAGGGHPAMVEELTALVAAHPLRERLAELLMIALHRNGRRAEALEVYRGARRRLVDELGLEPGAALRAVEQRVLAGASGDRPPEPDLAPPAQLPHNVRGFVGRERELSELDSLLDCGQETPATALVVGTAGVGKTALAVRWAHQVRDRFPDGQLYVDLRGYGPEEPMSPEQALAALLRALGVDSTRISASLDERSARFRSLVDGKRMLLLLDNARTVEHVRPLLAGTPTVAVVVTSRDMLAGLVARDGAERVVVDRLSVAESVTLLGTLAGGRLDDAAGEAAALAEQCARLPLALRIAAELIRARPSGSVAELRHELTGEHRRLDMFGVDGDPHTAVRAAFSWSYQHLSPAAARLFRFLGLHPGQDLDRFALTALTGDTLADTMRALTDLIRAHLVDEVHHGRYQPHDLLRFYAAELVAADPERGAALARLCHFYRHGAATAVDVLLPDSKETRPVVPAPAGVAAGIADETAAWRWLDAERANLIAVATHDPHGNAPALSRILWWYLSTAGHLEDAETVHSLALTVARERDDVPGQADSLSFLSLVHSRRSRVAESVLAAESALALYAEAGDRYGQAVVQNNLASTYVMAGRYREAIPRFERTIELFERLGRPRPATVLANLGAIHRFVGAPARAFDLVWQGHDAAVAAGDRPAQAYATHHLAVLHEYTGDHGPALECAERALVMARQLGLHVLGAQVVNHLGMVHRGLGRHDEAFRCHREALAIARRDENHDLAAQALNGLAETHLVTGDALSALLHHREAITAASACDSPYEKARAHAGLGDAHALLGDTGEAREHWSRAMAVFADLGTPEEAAMHARLAGRHHGADAMSHTG
jgi:DNA-binding SARP family transcriptional activator